eukprot:2605549-Amphidinium_carterae.1
MCADVLEIEVWPGMPSPVPLGTETSHDADFLAQDDTDKLLRRGLRAGTAAHILRSMKEIEQD